VLSGRGLYGELITRPEKSYRLWCVVVCDLETSWMMRPWPTWGCCAKDKQTNSQQLVIRHNPNRLLQSTHSYPVYFRSILIMLCHLNLGLSRIFFHSVFPTKVLNLLPTQRNSQANHSPALRHSGSINLFVT